MSEIIHAVERGTSLISVETRLEEMKSLSENINGYKFNSEELIAFSQNLKLQHNYIGCYFTNSFIVDKNISIVGASFFGPRYTNTAKYSVKMQLGKLWMDGKEIKKSILAMTEKAAIGKCGEKFIVDFDYPVAIEPSAIKYTLAFKLIGPETMGLDPVKMKSRDCVEGVTFYFWPGSQQMPEIRFTKQGYISEG